MSRFRTKLTAWFFGLLCLGGVIVTETSITTSPVPATADDAAPTIESDLEGKDFEIRDLVARMAPLHAHSTSETNEQARAAAQEIIFEGIYVSGTNEHGHGGSASWGQFTPNGPIKETLVKLPRTYKHVARNPDAEVWYRLDGGGVDKCELNGNRPTALTLPFGLPRLS